MSFQIDISNLVTKTALSTLEIELLAFKSLKLHQSIDLNTHV